MALRKLSDLSVIVATLLAACVYCPTAFAQGPLPDAPTPSSSSALVEPVIIQPRNTEHAAHKFWDTENRFLFLTVAAFNGADFAVTRANLQSGGQELNPVVRLFGTSTPGLAANFAGETASVMTLSYFFHKTGHHKLERAVSIVNIGCSAGAVTYGLTHRASK